MLLKVAERTSDVLQQSRLLLLVLTRYPEKSTEQGVGVWLLLRICLLSVFATGYMPVKVLQCITSTLYTISYTFLDPGQIYMYYGDVTIC